MSLLPQAIEQNSSKQEISNNFPKTSFDIFEANFDVLNEEIDDLETLITAEFAQGLPSDVELDGF